LTEITEQVFRVKADEALDTARAALLPLADEADFEIELQNGVMQIVFDEPPGKFVVSPNAPVRQIWISALSRSFKLPWSEPSNTFALDGEPLNTLLERLIKQHLSMGD
jgi:CyaY protein